MESVQDKVLNAHGGKKTLVYTKRISSYNRPASKSLGKYNTPNKVLGCYTGKC